MNTQEITFITCQEVADMLKVKISTIYSWLSYGQIPENIYRKLGRKPIFIKEKVIEWFMTGAELKKRQTKGEII